MRTEHRRTRFWVTGLIAGVVLGGVGYGAAATPSVVKPPQPKTLVTVPGPIVGFAQDGNHLAWMTRAGRCGYRLQIRALSRRRTVAIDGVACIDSDQSDLLNELAIANGRALWSVFESASISQFGIAVRTASFGDPRIRTLPCCDVYHDALDLVPDFPLAGHGKMLVYYSHRDEGEKERAIRRVHGGTSSKVFDAERPVELAVDRGRIAFVRRERGEHCACSFRPVWSPDGTRIAFLRTDGPVYDPFSSGIFDPGRPTEIAVMNADGTGLSVLTSDRRHRSALDWSHDGTKFVYAYDADESKIAVANADGTDVREVATGYEPEWSPSGAAIVFENGGVVSVVNSDGTGLRRLVRGEQPSWSPDGTRIAFSRGFLRGGLYVMRSDGTAVRRIARQDYGAGNPTWSPDGRRIAYDGNDGLYRVNTDGTARRRLTKDGRDSWPHWAPDGRRLVLSSRRDDLDSDDAEYESELYVVGASDGSGLRSLTGRGEWRAVGEVRSSTGDMLGAFRARGEPRALALSGGLVAVLTQPRAGLGRIVLFDARSGEQQGVVGVPRHADAALGAGGRWVVFSVGPLIKAIDVRTRLTRVLVRTTGTPIGLSVSGKRVAWAENVRSNKSQIRAVTLP